jgi:hypothetical protein
MVGRASCLRQTSLAWPRFGQPWTAVLPNGDRVWSARPRNTSRGDWARHAWPCYASLFQACPVYPEQRRGEPAEGERPGEGKGAAAHTLSLVLSLRGRGLSAVERQSHEITSHDMLLERSRSGCDRFSLVLACGAGLFIPFTPNNVEGSIIEGPKPAARIGGDRACPARPVYPVYPERSGSAVEGSVAEGSGVEGSAAALAPFRSAAVPRQRRESPPYNRRSHRLFAVTSPARDSCHCKGNMSP